MAAFAKDFAKLQKREIEKLVGKAGTAAMREITKRIANKAKSLVRVKSGKLKKSIRRRTRRARTEDAVRGFVFAEAPHAHLIELGWKPKRATGPGASLSSTAKTLTGKRAGPFPFLRPALDSINIDHFAREMKLSRQV